LPLRLRAPALSAFMWPPMAGRLPECPKSKVSFFSLPPSSTRERVCL
jgi:hypothetical protein